MVDSALDGFCIQLSVLSASRRDTRATHRDTLAEPALTLSFVVNVRSVINATRLEVSAGIPSALHTLIQASGNVRNHAVATDMDG